MEGESVVCPWHSWTFSLKTGEAEFPVGQRVRVYEVKAVGEEILVDLE